MRYTARLNKIAQSLAPETPWALLAEAQARLHARARLKCCRLLGVDATDVSVIAAASQLTDDTEAQVDADTALVASWQQGHSTGDVRARLVARLDEMAARLTAAQR